VIVARLKIADANAFHKGDHLKVVVVTVDLTGDHPSAEVDLLATVE
jgi:hypothetical protein